MKTKKRARTESVNSREIDSMWNASALRALCEAQGLRAEDLAVATGASAATATRWLSGRTIPSLPSGKRIACRLGVETDALLTDDALMPCSAGSSSARAAKH